MVWLRLETPDVGDLWDGLMRLMRHHCDGPWEPSMSLAAISRLDCNHVHVHCTLLVCSQISHEFEVGAK